MHPYVQSSTIHNSQDMEKPKCPLRDEWIRMCYIHTTEYYYSAIKKNKIMPLAATWMNLGIIILSEVNQKEKRQISYDITYMWNLNYLTNELVYQRETDSQT